MNEVLAPTLGLIELLSYMLGIKSFPTNFQFALDLFQNDYQPVLSSTYSNFQLANFSGYSTVYVSPSALMPPVDQGGGIVQISSRVNPYKWFNYGTQQMVWGYLVTNPTTKNVLWTQWFQTGVLVQFKRTISVNFALQLATSSM